MTEAVAQVLDDSKTHVLSQWIDFLQDPNVGCQLSLTTNLTGDDPELTCTFTEAALWGLKFDTSANITQFGAKDYNLTDSVIIGLPASTTTPATPSAEASTTSLTTALPTPPATTSTESSTISPETSPTQPLTPPTLIDVLQKFGVADSNGNIPFDDGSYTSNTTPADPVGGTPPSPNAGTLMQTIVTTLGKSFALQVDPTASRNAFWLSPGQIMRTDVALTFAPPKGSTSATALQSLSSAIYSHLGIDSSTVTVFSSLKMVAQKTALGYPVSQIDESVDPPVTATSIHTTSYYSLGFQCVAGPFVFWVTLSASGLNFTVLQNPDPKSSEANFGTLTGYSSPVLGGILSAIEILKVSATIDPTMGTYWSTRFRLKLGKVDAYLDYDSSTSTFTGGLILGHFFSTPGDQFKPEFAASNAIMPPPGYVATYFYDIIDISKNLSSLPNSLPTHLVMATISYQTKTETLSLTAKLVAPPPPPSSSTDPQVPAPFTWDELDVNLMAGGSGSFSCTMATDFLLGDPLNPGNIGIIGLNLDYQSGDWLLSGFAQNINGAMLIDFFDPNYRSSLVSVLGALEIPQLTMMYTYAHGGAATSFACVGVVQVDVIQLRLFYQYASSNAGAKTAAQETLLGTQGSFLPADAPVPPLAVKPATDPSDPSIKKVQTDWSFECDLGASAPSGQTATLGSVINSLAPDIAGALPPFVLGIKIPSADSGRSPITIKIAKHGTNQIAFAFQVEIEHVSFTFAQIGQKEEFKSKKLIRIAVDSLPKIPGIPLIGELPQPFDGLEYLWVNDAGGFLKSDITALNDMVMPADNPLYFSENAGQPADAKPSAADSVVIVPGHHFMVLKGQAAVLDHVFARSTTTVPPSLSSSSGPEALAEPGGTAALTAASSEDTPGAVAPPAPASPPSKGSLTLSLGPLTISAISLQYQEQGGNPQLSFTLDATFTMGPMMLELIGFGFSVPLTGSIALDNLTSLLGNMSPVLFGMDVSFDKPPLLIAGGFEHIVTATQDDYLGAIGITYPPYSFVGVGEYAILDNYKSVFLYAKLNGPIITLEFAEITGVRMGFGYNSFVRAPDVNELTSFPFIDDTVTASANGDPFKVVQTMTQTSPPWVTPAADQYWLAAGLSASAFDCLTVTAVAMLEVKTGGFDLAIYGDAVAMMPPDATSRDECLVYVELGLSVDLNMIEGYFRVEAALAPTSFLLVPECQLTGGFALVYWFGSNPHAGDWVFSVGGYHPQYQVPDWYPVPQRLAISFTVGSCLSITGNCYFAVTPKVVMGGALIHASLHLGPLQAWLDAQFDCLINFHPLHYMAEFTVSVGVSFNIDILFIHIHISASIGADLVIQGPVFGGTAHVDFWAFGFTVDFGSSPDSKPPLTLLQFWQMLHSPGPEVSSKNAVDQDRVQTVVQYDPRADLEGTKVPAPTGTGTVPYLIPPPQIVETAALKFVLENGNYPNPPTLVPDPTAPVSGTVTAPDTSNAGQGTKWFVKGGTFQFRIQTEFALSYASVQSALNPAEDGKGAEVPVLKGGSHPTKTNIFSRPMHASTDIISELNVTIVETATQKVVGGWTAAEFDTKSVPTGTWGKYSTDTDPLTGAASSLMTHDNATVPLPMGLLLSSPLPYLAPSAIPVFKASDAANMGVVDLRFISTMPGTNWFVSGYSPVRKAAANASTPGGIDYTPVGPDLNPTSGVVLAPTQVSYMPAELTPTEKKETNQQLWDGLAVDWMQYANHGNGLVNDPEDGLLATIGDIFGWEQNTSPAANSDNPQKLRGGFPAKLVRSAKKDGTIVKGLEANYLALPRRATAPQAEGMVF